MDHDRPRVAIFHPELCLGGGSQARALWLAMALRDDHRVELISMGPIDLDRLNRFYGTRLGRSEIGTISIKTPRPLVGRFDALRSYGLGRWARANAHRYDLMISTYNVMDFGRPGIQFIADFSFDDNLRRRFDSGSPGLKSLGYRKSVGRSAYLWLGRFLARQTRLGWKRNLTVANSAWSSGVVSRAYGLSCEVIYPPVGGTFPPHSWEERECGFVALGRVRPEKRLERIVSILSRVRARGFNVHLHIIGGLDESSYARRIGRLGRENADWVFLEGLKGGKEKEDFLAGHRFGVSGRQSEPFGIAVAEMVKAGCLVWVPNGGGQTEIVEHPGLTYSDDDDAAAKIVAVLESEKAQESLRRHLRVRAQAFSPERFMRESRALVAEFLERRGERA
jgi:glycosyltransferase involved in cell wall biosynthesis